MDFSVRTDINNGDPAGQNAIHKVGVRTALAPRREPYWGPPLGLNPIRLGYRKIAEGRGS